MKKPMEGRIRKMHPVVTEFFARLEKMQQTGDESNLEDGMNALARVLFESGAEIPERISRELMRIGAIMLRTMIKG